MSGRRGLNRLNARRRKLIKGIGQGLTIAETGKYAGYAHRQTTHRAFRSIQVELPEALREAGFPIDQLLTELIAKLRSQLHAKETLFFSHEGVVLDTRQVDAHHIQLDAARQICKLLGLYPVGRSARRTTLQDYGRI